MEIHEGQFKVETARREPTLDVCPSSPAVARLIEEVRGSGFEVSRAYNRTYNRHNR